MNQRDPERIIGTARFDVALLVKRQLLEQKEILSGQVRPRSETERYQPEGVGLIDNRIDFLVGTGYFGSGRSTP